MASKIYLLTGGISMSVAGLIKVIFWSIKTNIKDRFPLTK